MIMIIDLSRFKSFLLCEYILSPTYNEKIKYFIHKIR
jgi:hypothetical protein